MSAHPNHETAPRIDCRAQLVRELHRISADGIETIRAMQVSVTPVGASADGAPASALPSDCQGAGISPAFGEIGRRMGRGLVDVSDAVMLTLHLLAIDADCEPGELVARLVMGAAQARGFAALAEALEHHSGGLSGCDISRHADSARQNPARGERYQGPGSDEPLETLKGGTGR